MENIRELSLKWFRNLSEFEKVEIIKKYFPGIDSILISKSCSKIELIYKKEFNL
jgi:hypothetical protein